MLCHVNSNHNLIVPVAFLDICRPPSAKYWSWSLAHPQDTIEYAALSTFAVYFLNYTTDCSLGEILSKIQQAQNEVKECFKAPQNYVL